MSNKRVGKDGEVSGNAMASAMAVQRQLIRAAEQVARAEGTFRWHEDRDRDILAIRVRMPQHAEGEYMAVVSADSDEGPVVAFHSAPTFGETIVGLLARLENDTLVWKEDKYAKRG